MICSCKQPTDVYLFIAQMLIKQAHFERLWYFKQSRMRVGD